jgi:pilus assembly protein CpaE
MSNVLRLALVDPRDETREKMKSMLIGMDVVWLEAECSRYEFFGDVVAQTNPDVGVVCMDASPDKAISLIERIRTSSPDCIILALSQSTDGPTILKAPKNF